MSEAVRPVLHLERIFAAPRPVVFDYFVVPDLICQWWGPAGSKTEAVEVDLRVGGLCRWHMRTAGGAMTYLIGIFHELVVPERIVMTHRWEGMAAETLVTLEFIELGANTLVRLTHARIPDQTLLPQYRDGWSGTLDRLEQVLRNLNQ